MISVDSMRQMWRDAKDKLNDIFKPRELVKLARATGFVRRETSLIKGPDFIDLMTWASVDPEIVPLTGLCAALRDKNPQTSLTSQSLMERINQPEAAEFMQSAFKEALEKGLKAAVELVSAKPLNHFTNVWIEDCSECTLNEKLQEQFKGSSGGASKASVKIDLIYEAKRKLVHSVELTDRRSPDQKLAHRHLTITKANDLWIRDLGFFDIKVFELIISANAFFLSRLLPSANVYLSKEDQEPTDIAAYINLHYSNCKVVDLQVYVGGQKLPCRLIAYPVPKELAERRRRNANKQAVKRGQKQKQSSVSRLDFSFFITNVPKEIWAPEIVGTVYSLRWQIELIFKTWKSSLSIHYLVGTNHNRIRCLLFGRLIVIVVIGIIYQLASAHAQQIGRQISLHKLVNWLKQSCRLALAISGDSAHRLFLSLVAEMPKTLCKDVRKRKTTEEALEMGIPYWDLYNHSKVYST